MPNRKKVAIIMGSDSDWPVVKSACGVLKDIDVPFEAHILSAPRTPEAAAALAKTASAKALLATVQLPSGFPVATVALNGAKNAAYLAVAILAVADDELAAKLDQFRADTAAAIAKKDAAIAAEAAAM